jgi:cytochrome c oxidase subunit 2
MRTILQRTFATANELHVPVGRPVLMSLRADGRHPQLLGAEASPARRTFPARVTIRLSRRCGGHLLAGNARSSAGTSTPTWRSSSSRRPADYDALGSTSSASRQEPSPRRSSAGAISSSGRAALCATTIAGRRPRDGAPRSHHVASRSSLAAGTLTKRAASRATGSRIRTISSPASTCRLWRRADRSRRDVRLPRVVAMTARADLR